MACLYISPFFDYQRCLILMRPDVFQKVMLAGLLVSLVQVLILVVALVALICLVVEDPTRSIDLPVWPGAAQGRTQSTVGRGLKPTLSEAEFAS